MGANEGTGKPFEVEVGLHRGFTLNPFPFAVMIHGCQNIRKEAPRHMMFADDVVLSAREKDVLEMDLGQWREALEKILMTVPRANTGNMCVNGTQS